MKKLIYIVLLFTCLGFGLLNCSNGNQVANDTVNKKNTSTSQPSSKEDNTLSVMQQFGSMTDSRDGEVYATVTIGNQTWMAENLRFNTSGSILNPNNPTKAYGRLYEIIPAQTACPNGWHLPSDSEWDEVEMAHGMPASFIGKGGWRGKHATNLKSSTDWGEDGNGTNLLGFNILPAGYYTSEKMGFENSGLEGLGYSAAFWSSVENNIGFARFLFSSREFVNKWADTNNDSGAALACRCVKD